MTRKRIYIGGPMTGLPNFNFPAFLEAEEKLKAEGWWPVSPARHDLAEGYVELVGGEYRTTPLFSLDEVLRWDLDAVSWCDAIYLLPGWENSKGARAEHAAAVAFGKEIIIEPILPALFGVGGLLASGKDTFADHLVEKHGFVKLNMSEPLHEAMLTLNPVVEVFDEAMGGECHYAEVIKRDGYTDAKKNPEVRRLLQVLGTEIGRKMFGENVWVDLAGRKIDELRSAGKPVVITGIRYPNELAMIQDRKGESVWVSRGGQTAISTHLSENAVTDEDFDHYITNHGTIADLHAKADRLIESKEKAA